VADFKLMDSGERGRQRWSRLPPHFKPDMTKQLDPLVGAPECQVPQGHLARRVRDWVELLDTTQLEDGYSELGRHGHAPKRVLAVWVYASLQGQHHASKVAALTETDAAYRLLSGGHKISASVLCTFRRERQKFLADAVQQTVKLAVGRELLDPDQLAVDSVRLRANASTKSMRTLARSSKRLEELSKVDQTKLDEAARQQHEEKVAKHAEAVRRCEAEGRTGFSTTNPTAALMKFPDGASLPGHRVTVTAAGSWLRFVVDVLVTNKGNDFGSLEEAVTRARDTLRAAGLPENRKLQVAADPGYLSTADLAFAAASRDWVDVLVHEPSPERRSKDRSKEGVFGRDRFAIHEDGTAVCPAGQMMKGPTWQTATRRIWRGEGCTECPIKAQCTPGRCRSLTQDIESDRVYEAMRERMAEPGAKERYNRRIATVEPVFGTIEEKMAFRRSSSRKAVTVDSEILLKVLAYNLSRLAAGLPLRWIQVAGVQDQDGTRILAAWAPLWDYLPDDETSDDPEPQPGQKGRMARPVSGRDDQGDGPWALRDAREVFSLTL
jgi:transposase